MSQTDVQLSKTTVMRNMILLLSAILLVVSCTDNESGIDALRRAQVDNLNKQAFQLRYRDGDRACQYAYSALRYIDDSLPLYHDGRLRAWNNLATAYYFQSKLDSTHRYTDSVISSRIESPHYEVEQTIAQLLRARMLQRNCQIADAYRILYDIDQSGQLDNYRSDDLLQNFAISQYYITTSTLNYYYRNKQNQEAPSLLNEMERRRPMLRCDFAEDMSFNYALAYGYSSRCNDTADQATNLAKALRYCKENILLLSDSMRFSTFHLANTYQLLASLLSNKAISSASWRENQSTLDGICRLTDSFFGFHIGNESDTALTFYRESTALFWQYDDPYQKLGALVATGRRCMALGDTALARDYFNLALLDSTLICPAPKFEAALYEGFLTAGCAETLDDVAEWSRKEIDLLNYISRNQRADFVLQLQLDQSKRDRSTFLAFAILMAVLALALLLALILLRRRTLALQRETLQLQQTQRQDVERIANVETCLSVLRHDITPFISYLQNDNLPDELHREVVTQLIRTFENIKRWTNLSLPTGLKFRPSQVSMQQIFETTVATAHNPHGDSVALRIEPTDFTVQGDAQLLEILLRNLTANALRHTAHGTVTLSATSYSDDDRFVLCSVADTGTGIDPEQLPLLFRADRKPHPDAVNQGSGFGLILCRYIIKMHDDNTLRGCRIWAESKLGEGATFYFLLAKAKQNNVTNP